MQQQYQVGYISVDRRCDEQRFDHDCRHDDRIADHLHRRLDSITRHDVSSDQPCHHRTRNRTCHLSSDHRGLGEG